MQVHDYSSSSLDEELLVSLNRDSPQPLYDQIRDIIIDVIETTPLQANESIPSERELAKKCGVNRLTVRKAVDLLVKEGRLYRRQGKGTYVSPPRIRQPLLVMRGFSQAVLQEGHVPTMRARSVELLEGSARVCRRLGIDSGSPVIKLVRVGFADGVPLAIITSYLPGDLMNCMELNDFETDSLYRLMRDKADIRLIRGEATFEPTVADYWEAELLDIFPKQPLMLIRGTVFTKNSRVVEYYKALYRGDKVLFATSSDLT